MRLRKYQTLLNPAGGRRVLSFKRACTWGVVAAAITLTIIFGQHVQLKAQSEKTKPPDVTGYYQFTISDTLAILDNHGSLQGHLDIFQPNEVPKPMVSYNITQGSISKNHLEFRTQEIYGKRYLFSGIVKHGAGKARGDYDYLQLAGSLETITANPAPGKKKVASCHAIFRSLAQELEGS